MTRRFMTKYIRIDSRGNYKYRRRVPAKLQPTLGKKEFVKLLGKSEPEAMLAYGPFHEHVEKLLVLTQPVSEQGDLLAIKMALEAEFIEAGLDPSSSGRSEGEHIARDAVAEKILQSYPCDPETGYPDRERLSLEDHARVTALLSGVHEISAEPTVQNAFAFYLAEKEEPDPKKRKSQISRVRRIERELLSVIGQDIPLPQLRREHARQLRDRLKGQKRSKSPDAKPIKVSAVKRNLGIAKAVINFAIREYDLDINNPFERLDIGRDSESAIDLKLPLPRDVIIAMYKDLQNNAVFLDVWTLLHHTGAQNAEILGLNRRNLFLDAEVPHFEIKPEGLRTVKARSRIRKVPLVGLALDVSKRLHSTTPADGYLFPQYAPTHKHDSFSASVMKRLRKFTDNPKHTIYSLRHKMKDALRESGAGQRVELALLGHASERSASDQYGSKVSLLEMKNALEKIQFDVPED